MTRFYFVWQGPATEIKFKLKGKIGIYGAMIEKLAVGANFIPSDLNEYLLFLEKSTPRPPSNTIGSGNDIGAFFKYFIYNLYGIKGEFKTVYFNSANPNVLAYFALDSEKENEKRLSCGNTPCWTLQDDSRNNITRYKNSQSLESVNLYKFFRAELIKYIGQVQSYNAFKNLPNGDWFPILYNDYNGKMILRKISETNTSTSFRMDEKLWESDSEPETSFYRSVIDEVRDLMIKFNSFSFNETVIERKSVAFPVGYPDDRLKPIPPSELNKIAFSGKLTKPETLYIQAGYARYYPFVNADQTPKLKGYFYENSNFASIRNYNIVNDNLSVRIAFPNNKEDINKMGEIAANDIIVFNDIQRAGLTKLLKNNNSFTFEKIINTKVFLNNCFYKVSKEVNLTLKGTFLEARKRISDVWRVEIKRFPASPSAFNIFTSATSSPFPSFQVSNFGTAKDNTFKNLYLKVTYNRDPNINFINEDEAKITLFISSEGQTLSESSILI